LRDFEKLTGILTEKQLAVPATFRNIRVSRKLPFPGHLTRRFGAIIGVGYRWKMKMEDTRSPAIEKWLREQVGPACDNLKADPLHALTVDEVQARLARSRERMEAFRQAEASLRLEGLDPIGDVHYEAIKARVIVGELTIAEGKAEILARHRQQSAAAK
jgi:hypothetical protein